MSYSTVVGGTTIATTPGVTTVECHKQVRSWRLLRYLLELLIPCCNCSSFIEEKETIKEEKHINNLHHPQPTFTSLNIITGTIFGYRRGKVRFCIQTNSKSNNPILLLELAVPTTSLAKEMQGGILRLALECTGTPGYGSNSDQSLLSMPVWTMYCNGRKVGYAVKRKISKSDMDVLRLMDSVVVGAGIISGKELDHHDHEDQVMYLRANFQRVCGSPDSESYHLIDPDGNIDQELSIFFYRSQ